MDGMGIHSRLTRGQRRALGFAVAVVLAGMAMGFASSFTTLYHAARLHSWALPWLLPLSVDSGILAYVVLDHLAVTLGSRSRWLHLAAWSLAAFTVWANAAVSPAGGPAWRVIHAAMPALWVLGVEALRFTWRRLHEQPGRPEAIPRGRWAAAPWPTLVLWRRMRLLHVTSYPYAVALAEAAALARDLVSADPGWEHAPALLRSRIEGWRLPSAVHASIAAALGDGTMPDAEYAVEAWVRRELTRPDRHSAALSGERRDIAAATVPGVPETVPETVPGARPAAGPQARPEARSGPSLRLAASRSRSMSAGDLVPHVAAMLEAYGTVSQARVKRDLHVSTEKAAEALRLAKRDRPASLDEARQKRA